jgi:hypothetical protein
LATRRQLLDQALILTREMADLGDSGDWEAVIDTESRRRRLLEQAFATRAPVDDDLARQVREILDIDQRLLEQSRRARDEVAGLLGQATRGRAAASAYRATAGGEAAGRDGG